jgi:hypothetical protein
MEIVNYREGTPSDKYVGIFDIYLGSVWGVTYRNWRLVHGKHGLFISGPSFSVGEPPDKKYFQYIEFSAEKKKDFENKILDLLKPYLRK